jgi:A/G-specific adenine glycosylase
MDPWLVMAAELALDRTSIADLNRRFSALTTIAPSPEALFSHPAAGTALEAEGLSSHAAMALTDAADTVMELFDGEIPAEDLELRTIPGVGDSLAKMVMSFGYGRKAVPLHAAAARVAARVTGQGATRRWQLRLDLHRLAGPSGPDPLFNAAVIQLGGTLCRSVAPQCSACPLRKHCATARADTCQPRREVVAA